jgi:hypothetical protein
VDFKLLNVARSFRNINANGVVTQGVLAFLVKNALFAKFLKFFALPLQGFVFELKIA